MRVVILYRPKSEQARNVETFVQEFKHRYEDSKIELLDIDSRDGGALASLYDVTRYPAILALSGDGQPLNIWQGEMLPLMDEVSYYMYAGA